MQNNLKKRKESLMVSGGILVTDGVEDDVQNLLCYEEGGTVEVHPWIREVSCDVFEG